MKQFYPTYLYVKTHNISGLKYFGKTSKDPMKYRGSGKHWLRHLKKHGNNVTTEIIGFYTDKEECKSAALHFSAINNITESTSWANMVVENGLDGGYTGPREYGPVSQHTREKISAARVGMPAWNKGLTGVTPGNKNPRSEETKRKLSEANKGKKRSAAEIEKTASKLRGRRRPELSERLKGRTVSEATREKIAAGNRGKIVSAETKQKIREARVKQIFTDETRRKLSGQVVVIDKQGELSRISKEIYYSQTGPKENWEWVMHRSTEAKSRKKT